MIPRAFEYVRPDSLSEAIRLLVDGGEEAKLLSGGHSLLPMMKLRLASPSKLIDVSELTDLRGITIDANEVVIGAATTHAELEHHVELNGVLPMFATVGHQIADPTVRNRGTLGGALAHADPSADWPAAMLALDAKLDVMGAKGTRSIAADSFFKGLFETALESDEIIVRVRVPVVPDRRVAYRKFRHPASGYAVVGVAVVLALQASQCTGGRIAVTGFADHAYRAKHAEEMLAGYAGQPAQTEQLLDLAFSEVTPLEDRFVDADYRIQLGRTMLRRALADAMSTDGCH
ncbi:FAD binding domain-containing protein [Paraburkholderia sp. MM5482-R1]|uniref:FAD binding domain-containing protein n=1 Tax=unclassified Paraburkholderia TaxID=2615204 RepID=UPI003D190F41